MKSLLAFSLDNIYLGQDTSNTLGNTYSTTAPLISTVLKVSLTVAGIILIALLIFGGITFIISAGNGDDKKAAQGKKAITNAAIGFAIVLLSYSIIKLIETITHYPILSPAL